MKRKTVIALKTVLLSSTILIGALSTGNTTVSAQELTAVERIEIINSLYSAMNTMQLEELDGYLTADIEVVPVYGSSPPTAGKAEVSEMLKQMLALAKNSRFEFSSGPFAMGDVVSVEYMHHYELEGEPRQDHNVSIFVFEDRKIRKWLGYIHQD